MKIRRTILSLERLEDRCTPATWGNPWPDALHLTLSFAPDGTQVGSQTSNLFQTLNAVAPTKTWETQILLAFQTWASLANINLTVVPDQGQPLGTPGVIQSDPRFGDIRIAASPMPLGAVAIATPFELDAGTWSGDVQLNSAESFGVNGSGTYDLYTVMLHEAGHVFGFPDNTNPASVEDGQYLGVRTGLGAVDVAALQALYGARAPATTGNSQLSTATPLNVLAGTTVAANISTLQDQDFYSFSTLTPGAVNVTVQTAGVSLLTPSVIVYNAAGKTIVSGVDTDPFQGGLVIHLPKVRALSTYYVEVESGQQDPFGIGSYKLTVSEVPLLSNLLGLATATVTQGVAAARTPLLTTLDSNDSFAAAHTLPPMFDGPGGAYYDGYRSSLGNSGDVDYYTLQAPSAASGTTGDVLTALVWGLEGQLDPLVLVYDAQHNLIPAEVLVDEGSTYVVQIGAAVPQATYYVEVLAANPSGSQSTGNYFLGVNFTPNGVNLLDYADGTLTAAQPQVINTLTVSQSSQLCHFVLSAAASATGAGNVQMTILDATGQAVFTLAAGIQQTATGNVSLVPGQYTVLFSAVPTSGGALLPWTFQLSGETLTDPEGPEPTDPTGGSGGSSGSGQITVTGGGSTGVSPQDPSSSSSDQTGNQPVVTLYDPGDQTDLGGDQVSLSLSYFDSANNTVSFSATGLPPGLSIDSSAGVISGTIANNAANANPYIVTVTATDTTASATQAFQWTVNPPVVTVISPGDQTNLGGDTVYLSVAAWSTDNYPVTFSAAGLPPGLSIDSSAGLISGTIPNNTAGSYSVTLTATDTSASVSASQTLQWTVNPPVVTVVGPGDQTNLGGDTVSLSVAAWSTDNYPVTYSAAGLPPGLSIDSSAGLISGTIPNNAAGSYSVTLSAADTSASVSAGQTFQWTVNPPVITVVSPGDQTNLGGDTVSLSVAAWSTDNFPVTYSAAGLPPGLSIDSSAGLISGTIPNNAAGSYSVTLTATDTSANVSASQTFQWTVNPPVVTVASPGDQTNLGGDTVSLSVAAWSTDNFPVTYNAAGLPPGLSINSSTGVISGTIATGAASTNPYVVTVTATDTSANVSANVSFQWTVSAAPPSN